MDLLAVLKTVAPWIATAMAGPLGGMAVEAAANALGASEKTAEAIKSALGGATPEQVLALKQADQAFALRMQELGYKRISDLEKIAADDRDSAREMQSMTRSLMPAVITAGILSSFIGALVALFFIPVPQENRDLIIYLVGQLSGFAGASVAFWLGTTRQSEEQSRLLAQAAPVEPK